MEQETMICVVWPATELGVFRGFRNSSRPSYAT